MHPPPHPLNDFKNLNERIFHENAYLRVHFSFKFRVTFNLLFK